MLRLFVRAFGGAGIGADSFLGVDLGFKRLFLAVDFLILSYLSYLIIWCKVGLIYSFTTIKE